MKRAVSLLALAMIPSFAATGQQEAKKPVSAARLELTTEVAATTENGYPSILRITLKNAGNVAVELPMPEQCVPGGGSLHVIHEVHSDNPFDGLELGTGHGCVRGDSQSIEKRIENEWIRLQPGEFIVLSDSTLRRSLQWVQQGTVEFWAEYTPPDVTVQEFAELTNSGHVIPTEKLESEHKSFHVQ
jgi:hypothetical protein